VDGSLKYEVAKAGKYGRLVVSFGVEASLIGAWYAKALKRAMANHPLVLRETEVRFVPEASYHWLKQGFDFLLYGAKRVRIIIFSDDAAVAVGHGDEARYYDLDISSCDKSHGPRLFDALHSLASPHCQHVSSLLIQQLRAPIRITNPANRAERVILKPRHPTLYSGSTLTTPTNCVALYTIGISIDYAGDFTQAGLYRAAARAGYIVTLKPCQCFDEVQFLKHSPTRDITGVYQPCLNMGVFLRAIGITNQDLPGRGPLSARAHDAVRAILMCSWPNTHFPMLSAMRARFGAEASPTESTVRAYNQLKPYAVITGWPTLHFTDEAVLHRYRVNPAPLRDFFHRAEVGETWYLPEIATLLGNDYDLSTQDIPNECRRGVQRTTRPRY
jgi:hypothetical protein